MPRDIEQELFDIIYRNKNCINLIEVTAIIDEMYNLDPSLVLFDTLRGLIQYVEDYNKPEQYEIRIAVAYALRHLDPKGELMASTDILSLLLTDSSEEVCVKGITLARNWQNYYKPTSAVLKAFNTFLTNKKLRIDAAWAVADFHPLEVLEIMQYRLSDLRKTMLLENSIIQLSEQLLALAPKVLKNVEKQPKLNEKLQWAIRKLAHAVIPVGFKPSDRNIFIINLSRSYPLLVLLEGTDIQYPLNTRINCMLGINEFNLTVFQLIKNFMPNHTNNPSLTKYPNKLKTPCLLDNNSISAIPLSTSKL